MDWDRHHSIWPHAETSSFVRCPPHRWHVQDSGSGPIVLLIHGAGGATQSWRHLIPLLRPSYRVIAIDLPGQGFTKPGSPARFGLEAMAQDITALCQAQGWQPAALIGHSAGAAVALQMALNVENPPVVIGINAALAHFKGLAGLAFPAMAKALSMAPFVARMFTVSAARPKSVTRLIEGTGSHLPEEELTQYRALISDAAHVDGTLKMMAQWNLTPLLKALPTYPGEVLLIAGTQDKAVPPSTSRTMAAQMPNAQVETIKGLGHLAHEEAPERIAQVILDHLSQTTQAAPKGRPAP